MKEQMYLAATAARLGQAVRLSRRIADGKSIVGTVGAIMAVDLADGIGARRAGVDGPKRRALDSATDAAIIATGLVSLYKKKPEARPYVGALAIREAFVGLGWAIDLAKTRQVKKGDDLHKLASGSIAAFSIAATSNSKSALRVTGLLAIGVNAVLAHDYYKGWTHPERNTILDTGVMEVPGFYEARNVGKLNNSLPQLMPGNGGSSVPPLELPTGV
jgi:hypothetical protein